MWIETAKPNWLQLLEQQFIRQQWRMWIETFAGCGCPRSLVNSFASNGECGLKLWSPLQGNVPSHLNSFASNGECGLKLRARRVCRPGQAEFIRQQWRMWIETAHRWCGRCWTANSFASNGECGLKPDPAPGSTLRSRNSFASNGECGLKQPGVLHRVVGRKIHSPAMANVD